MLSFLCSKESSGVGWWKTNIAWLAFSDHPCFPGSGKMIPGEEFGVRRTETRRPVRKLPLLDERWFGLNQDGGGCDREEWLGVSGRADLWVFIPDPQRVRAQEPGLRKSFSFTDGTTSEWTHLFRESPLLFSSSIGKPSTLVLQHHNCGITHSPVNRRVFNYNLSSCILLSSWIRSNSHPTVAWIATDAVALFQ